MRVTIVDLDDWQALYVDDILQYQDHSIPIGVLVKALTGEDPELIEPTEEQIDALVYGGFPHELRKLWSLLKDEVV